MLLRLLLDLLPVRRKKKRRRKKKKTMADLTSVMMMNKFKFISWHFNQLILRIITFGKVLHIYKLGTVSIDICSARVAHSSMSRCDATRSTCVYIYIYICIRRM
mmetsp:Transcript_32696/g.45602  ORF Transcript_32696/g.45602 Transcript_32696/m.45602 type:complete len:104 (-) Transcript_32696:7-318(-)